MHRLTGRWDSVWYQRIAEHGYGYGVRLPDGTFHSDLAFFPLLPALERGLSALFPPLGTAGAGLLISWLASLVAAGGIFAVGARLYGRRAGILLAVLWGRTRRRSCSPWRTPRRCSRRWRPGRCTPF